MHSVDSTATIRKPLHWGVAAPDRPVFGLNEIDKQFRKSLTRSADESDVYRELLELGVMLTNAVEARYFTCDKSNKLPVVKYQSAAERSETLQKPLSESEAATDDLALKVMPGGTTQVSKTNDFLVIGVPVFNEDQQPSVGALVFRLVAHAKSVEPFVVAAQLVASNLEKYHQLAKLQRSNLEVETTSVMIDLFERWVELDSVDEACLLLVNELKKVIACDLIAVGTSQGRTGKVVNVAAISGSARIERQSNDAMGFKKAMEECLALKRCVRWPNSMECSPSGLVGHKSLVEQNRYQNVVSFPIPKSDDQDAFLGVITFANYVESKWFTIDSMMSAVLSPVSKGIESVNKAQGGRTRKYVNWLRHNASWRNLVVSAALVTFLGLVLFWPIDHRIGCDCTVEPTTRRFVVAPYQGTLQKSNVQVGDLVQRGQILATMDAQDIQWELSTLKAKRAQAIKSIDSNLSQQNVGQMQIDQLEVKRLDLEIQILEEKLDRLELKAPFDGIVLRGDLADVEGGRVDLGDTLFELTPSDRLHLKINLDEADFQFVALGNRVEFWLSSLHDHFTGIVKHISPQAQLINNQNVFVLEVEIDRCTEVRPGMAGTAHVLSSPKTIGWIYICQPFHELRNWLRR
ncbi:MAG: HlyD family efflux transporter periplasmic adaptor subunit [Planctomycetota bacterium]